MTIDGSHRQSGDSGSALIIALVFLIIGSILVIALANLSGASLAAANSFSSQRNLAYAADGVTNAAIQANRYSASCKNLSLTWQSADGSSIAMQTSCTITTSSPEERIETILACLSTVSCNSSHALLTAQVQFLDVYTSGSTVLPRLGSSVSVQQWTVQTAS